MYYVEVHWQLPYDLKESYYYRYFSTRRDMIEWQSKWKPKEPHIQYVCEKGKTWWVNGVLCPSRFVFKRKEIENCDSGKYYYIETIRFHRKLIAYFDNEDTYNIYLKNPDFEVLRHGSCWFNNGQLMPAVEFE